MRFFPGDKGICYQNKVGKVRIENWQLDSLLEILASLYDKPRINTINSIQCIDFNSRCSRFMPPCLREVNTIASSDKKGGARIASIYFVAKW